MELIEKVLYPLLFAAVLGSGVVAGIFFAFSNFVMKGLGRLHAVSGIAAMQAINVTVLNPVFFGFFLGTALLSAVLLVVALLRWQDPGSVWLLAGGGLYLVGCLLVTVVGNVPLNEALAKVEPSKVESVPVWNDYLTRWNLLNHVRTVASLLAMAAYCIGLSRTVLA
ncbi:MAG: DUF1772 domain-containing protein [Gammaproteobacteria bacterium]|nr:DUF1772 domain-containing protein [Gammaproteobacteria bacterium]